MPSLRSSAKCPSWKQRPGQLGRVIGKKLTATADPSCLHDSDPAIAVLGTPVDEHLSPTVTDLYQSIEEVIARLPEKALLVLRSTVYPAVTKLRSWFTSA
jgi:UDP-N-acetyl-D-mannosaminuronic acid dehydrogenase